MDRLEKNLKQLIKDLGKEPTSQELLLEGVCNKINFLDLIRNFIVFEAQDGRVIKKLARYQQFRAVHKTLNRLKADPAVASGPFVTASNDILALLIYYGVTVGLILLRTHLIGG